MKSTISNAQLARLEKNLRAAAELGSALALLGREILKDVKSATAAIAEYRQSELPLPKGETPAESREKRYDENTKKLAEAFTPAARKRSKRSKR